MPETNPSMLELFQNIDMLVDRKFILSEKSLDVKFRGSKNQRIVDVKKSLEKYRAITNSKYEVHETEISRYKHPHYMFV